VQGGGVRQPSLYFREQWRTNTAGLAALAVAGLVIVGFVLWRLVPPAPTASTGSAQSTDEYRLSHNAVSIAGSSVKLFVLDRWHDHASGSAVNMLIVDGSDATSRWMFPDNGQTILSRDELHSGDGASVFSPVTGLVLTVSNTGGEASRESLYFYRVGGGPAVRFLTADDIISGQQVGSDRYLVLSRSGLHRTAAVYSLIDLRVLAEKPMPDIPE
jgi:hypothetical protein